MKTKKLYMALIAFAALSFQLSIQKVKAQVCFTPATNFAVGGDAFSIISADFNGDGKADLATANYSSNNVSVWLGNGLGSFGSATNFAGSGYAFSIISADFNGDGKADLATANYSSNNVSVWLGNGLGSFGSATNFA
ncbi:MAG: VCBS repeat-containing protein, partial [Bacteroidota bacterium]